MVRIHGSLWCLLRRARFMCKSTRSTLFANCLDSHFISTASISSRTSLKNSQIDGSLDSRPAKLDLEKSSLLLGQMPARITGFNVCPDENLDVGKESEDSAPAGSVGGGGILLGPDVQKLYLQYEKKDFMTGSVGGGGRKGASFPKKEKNQSMYSRLIARCQGGLGPEFSLPVFRKMRQSGVEVDVFTYNMVIKSLIAMTKEAVPVEKASTGVRARKMEYANMAIEFLREMRQTNVVPNILTYKAILSFLAAYGEARKFEEIRGWMEEDKVVKDVACMSYEIKLCIRTGDLKKASSLMNAAKAENVELPSSVLEWWMQSLASRDKVEELVDLLSESSSRLTSSKAFAIAFSCLGRFGYEREAMFYLKSLKLRVCKNKVDIPDLVTGYVSGVASTGKLDEAVVALRKMERAMSPLALDEVAYNVLIDTSCKQGRLSQGLDFLEEMQQKGLTLSAYSFNPFIREFCREVKLDDAFEVVKHMKRVGVMPTEVTYNNLIHLSVKADNMEMAYNLLADMKQHGIKPSAYTYNPIISGFGRKGLLQRALSVRGEMAADGVEPDAATFSVLLHACSHQKDEQRALKLLKDMETRGIKPTKYVVASMVSVLVRSGNLDRAIALTKEVENEGPKLGTEVKSVLLTGLASDGRLDEALRLYDRMKKEGIRPEAYAAGMLLGILGGAGDLNGMLAAFEEIKMSDWQPAQMSSYCMRVLIACLRHNQLGKAVEFLRKVKAEGIADEAMLFEKIFLDISTGGTEEDDKSWSKNVDDGFAMLQVMREMGVPPSRSILEALLDGCAASKDCTRAPDVVKELEQEGLPLNIFSRIRLFHAYVAGKDGMRALNALEEIPRDEFRDGDVRLFLYKILQPHYEAAAESPEKDASSQTFPHVRRRLDELAGGRMVNWTD